MSDFVRQDENDDVEVVDGVPVPEIGTAPREVPAPAPMAGGGARGSLVVSAGPVAAQAAAVAVTGFAAGAATVAVVRRHRAKKAVRARGKARGKALGDVLATRSFLVDVHLLSRD